MAAKWDGTSLRVHTWASAGRNASLGRFRVLFRLDTKYEIQDVKRPDETKDEAGNIERFEQHQDEAKDVYKRQI